MRDKLNLEKWVILIVSIFSASALMGTGWTIMKQIGGEGTYNLYDVEEPIYGDSRSEFVHWQNELTIQFYVNNNGAGDGLSWQQTSDAVSAGFQEWGSHAPSYHYLSFQDMGSTNTTLDASDGQNILYWAESDSDPGYPGVGNLAWVFYTINSDQELLDVDVIFNGLDYTWRDNGNDYDVQAVTTHEIGHMIGIGHHLIFSCSDGCQSCPTMCSNYFGVEQRSIQLDDDLAIEFLYNQEIRVPGSKPGDFQEITAALDEAVANSGQLIKVAEGDYIIGEDAYVKQGNTLELTEESIIQFGPQRSRTTGLIIQGKLVNPRDRYPIILEPTTGYSEWAGIRFEDSSDDESKLENVIINKAEIGISFYSASPTIVNCIIDQSSLYGIRLDNSEPNIEYSTIQNSGYYGIVAFNSYNPDYGTVNIRGNTIINNYRHGIALSNSSPTLENNEISGSGWYGVFGMNGSAPVLFKNHIWSNDNHGTKWINSSSPYLYYKGTYDFGGCNEISYNEGVGVFASNSSYPQLGLSSTYPGNNNIYENSSYEVWNNNGGSSWINAKYNWWGSSNGPESSDFYGLVKYIPYLIDNTECGIGQAASGESPPIQIENTPGYYNAMGIQLYGSGQVNAALQMFIHVLNNFPNSEGVFFALQQVIAIMQELGQQDQILQFLTVLSSNNIGTILHWYANLQSVFILERAGNYEGAIQLIESVLQDSTLAQETKYATALHRAMILSNGLQQNDAAIQAYTEFLASNPPEDLAIIAQGELDRLSELLLPLTLGKKAVEQTSNTHLPEKFRLAQNYPNPFNPITSIRYDLPEESMVVLTIYDLLGREVGTLVNSIENAGFKSLTWNGKDQYGRTLSSGMYFYRINAVSKETGKQFHQTRKMVLLK